VTAEGSRGLKPSAPGGMALDTGLERPAYRQSPLRG